MLKNQEAECLAPVPMMPPTYDISSSEIESIAPLLGNRNQKKSKATDYNRFLKDFFGDSYSPSESEQEQEKPIFLMKDLLGDFSSSDSEKEEESPRTTDRAMMKKPLSQLSCDVPPAPAFLPVRKEITILYFEPETVRGLT